MFESFFYQFKHFVTTPARMSEAFAKQSAQGRALWLGLPALLVAVLGVGALCWAQFGMAAGLENRYKKEAERSGRELVVVRKELDTERKMLLAAGASNPETTESDQIIPKDDPRQLKLDELLARERVYWEKLISLNPDEMEYRYQLALVCLEQGDPQRGLALMRAIAPDDEPGYGKAHLWLAMTYMGTRVQSQTEANRLRNMALQQAELCLKRDQTDSTAQAIKARLLMLEKRYEAAYLVYQDLFDKEPLYYERLIEINGLLDRESRNKPILERALLHFLAQLSNDEISTEAWYQSWGHVFKCQIIKRDFDKAESQLTQEIEKQSTTSDGIPKLLFLKQLLARLYLTWADSLPANQKNRVASVFEFLKKAYRYDPDNESVLHGFTHVVLSDDTELSRQASEIYDPFKHAQGSQVDAPWSVLNELGSYSMAQKKYSEAIRYYELARAKAPQNSTVLNNLAYTYLVCEKPNPERALKLVDEAIRFLPNTLLAKSALSNFFDTRGNAMMQLNRMTEAAASFEMAIQDRPNNRSILESLVKCYEGNDLSPAIYLERLKELDQQEAAEKKGTEEKNPQQNVSEAKRPAEESAATEKRDVNE